MTDRDLTRGLPLSRARHVAVVIAIGLTVILFSGAEPATFLHTPDSEFYFSLVQFGAEITDRAPTDAYFWTKLGAVLPARGLVMAFGPWAGFEAYRGLLLLVIVSAGYSVAPRGSSQFLRVAVGVLLGLNTVVLGFLGDTYVTGSGLAALSVLVALTVRWAGDAMMGWVVYPLPMGVALGWLLMINPYFAVLGSAVILGVFVARPGCAFQSWRSVVVSGLFMAVGSSLTAVLFVLAGTVVFPGLAWLETLRAWNAQLNMAAYTSPDLGWVRTETSLLVPLTCAALAIALSVLHRSSASLRIAASVAVSPVLMAIGYVSIRAGSTFEASFYNAMLWPGALIGLGLAFSTLAPVGRPLNSWGRTRSWLITLLGGAAVAVAGHWGKDLTATTGLLVALSIVGVGVGVGRDLVTRSVQVTLIAIYACAVGFQILQNGRPVEGGGVNWRVEYEDAFVPNDAESLLLRDYQVQSWIVSSTSDQDRVMVWAEWERKSHSAAAMSLWGWNSVSPDSTLGPWGQAALAAADPTVIATYATSPAAQDAIVEELRSVLTLDQPDCREFDSLWVCIYRVSGSVGGTA